MKITTAGSLLKYLEAEGEVPTREMGKRGARA